jgi:DNA-binding GntR family transcriptional regulator
LGAEICGLRRVAEACDHGGGRVDSRVVAIALIEAVEAGAIPHGSRLPSEPQLSKMLGVSNWIAKRAVTALVARGLAIRRPGIGAIVVNPRFVEQGESTR